MSRLDPTTGIRIKEEGEIKLMRLAGQVLASYIYTCGKILQDNRHHMTPIKLSDLIFYFIQQRAPGNINDWDFPFMHEPGYNYPICVSVNEELVHTKPSARPLKRGDIVKIDTGLSYRGYCADMTRIFIVGRDLTTALASQPKDRQRIVSAGSDNHILSNISAVTQALHNGAKQCFAGNKLKNIVTAIDRTMKSYPAWPVPKLCGHGIGRELHEMPFIPNRLDELSPVTGEIELQSGMVLCLEPMSTLYDCDIQQREDGAFVSKPQYPTFHIEDTVLVKKNGYEVLTTIGETS